MTIWHSPLETFPHRTRETAQHAEDAEETERAPSAASALLTVKFLLGRRALDFARRTRTVLLAMALSFLFIAQVAALTVSELMYHPVASPHDPPDPDTGEALEYIEVFNEGPETEDLGGHAFVEGVSYVFPQGTLLAPRSPT